MTSGRRSSGFRSPSKWVVVTGSKGVTPVTAGSVTFKDGDKVEIRWKAEWDTGSYAVTCSRTYGPHPKSGLPLIGSLVPRLLPDGDESGTFRWVGTRLEFRLVGEAFMDIKKPKGDLWLLLKPGDR